MLVDDGATQLQRVRHLTVLHGEMVRQQREALDLLIVSQALLQRVDTLRHHVDDLLVLAELCTVSELDAMLMGPSLKLTVLRHDEGRDELTLVSYDSHLVHELIHEEQRLDHLRSDILTVARLEEVLDALREIELAVLQITCITGMEEAVGIEGPLVELRPVVIAFRDRRTFQENLVILTYLNLYTVDGATAGSYRERLVLIIARHRGKTLCQAVTNNHEDADAVNELFHLLRELSSGCREDVRMLQA